MHTRKQFLKDAALIAVGSSLLPFNMFGLDAPIKSVPFYFDFHCHPGWSFASGFPAFDSSHTLSKTLADMQAGKVSGAFITLVADAPLIKLGATGVTIAGKYGTGDAWAEYKQQLNQLREAYRNVPVTLTSDLRDLNSNSKATIGYIAVEGADFLEGQLTNVEEAYQDGVRSIQLVHYVPNDVGDLQTSENTFHGLSSFGKELVSKMNQLGIAIDVAHASYETVKDVVKLTKAPILLSHSILELEADRPMARRAISKEHAKLISETGGVIGAWPSGFNKSFDEFVDNIQRLVDVAGIDHVGIGTDMDGNFKPVLSSYTQYPLLAEALKSKGLSSIDVGKIMGENAKTALAKIFKKK